MDLKREFLKALHEGMDHDSLLELVDGYQSRGMPAPEAYQQLHRLWLDFGFDSSDEDSELRNNLEYVMEKVWYECPAQK